MKPRRKNINVVVKKCHIKWGKYKSMTKCPIALALKDVGFINPRVSDYSVRLANCGSFYTPKKAYKFIYAFDAKRKVKPFKFTLSRRIYL